MRLIDADALPISFDGHTVSVWKKDLDAAPTINPYEWISVEDRLPDIDELCLLSMENRITKYRWVVIGYFHVNYDEYVTHWMPLPTPPTEKEN